MKYTTILSSVPGRRITELFRRRKGDNRDSDRTDLFDFCFCRGSGGVEVGLAEDLEPSNSLQRFLTLPLRKVSTTVSTGL